VKIDYDENAPPECAEIYAPSARTGGPKIKMVQKKNAKDNIRGRTDKMGTLLGFQDPFKKLEALPYSATSTVRAVLFSITRQQLKEILTTFTDDREHFEKAIEQANSTIKNAASGATRGSKNSAPNKHKTQDRPIPPGAETTSSSPGPNRAQTPTGESQRVNQILSEGTKDGQAAKDALVPFSNISNEEFADLRQKVDTLTKLVSEQFQMLEKLAADKEVMGAADGPEYQSTRDSRGSVCDLGRSSVRRQSSIGSNPETEGMNVAAIIS